MTLATADLALVRDEIGIATPPTDRQLQTSSDDLGGLWRLVALRYLKRRRAELLVLAAERSAETTSEGGGISSIAVPGAISVGFSSGGSSSSSTFAPSLAALDRQIERLEADHLASLDGDSGVTVSRLTRPGWR